MLTTAMRSPLGDEAFLAGLIHDVGVMVELQLDRAKLAVDTSVDLLDAEEHSFSATHLTKVLRLEARMTVLGGDDCRTSGDVECANANARTSQPR